MTAARKTRSTAPRRRAAGRRAAATPASPNPVLIGSLVLGAGVLLIIFMMGGGDGAARAATGDQPAEAAPVGEPDAAAPTPPAAPPSSGAGRAGTPPDRPAPPIAAGTFAAADALYAKAAGLWNRGQEARKTGTTADYQQALLDSWEVFEELYDGLAPYTAWFEEADLGGWAMPAEYGDLQRYLDKWDNLRMKVKKLKPIKRR